MKHRATSLFSLFVRRGLMKKIGPNFIPKAGEKKATSAVVNLKCLTPKDGLEGAILQNLRARNTKVQIALNVKGGVIEPSNTATYPSA